MPARPISPARVGSQPPLTRSARRRGATPPPPAPKAAAPAKSGGAGKTIFTVAIFVAAIAIAFLVGQSTRPSQAQVDKSINGAVASAKQSAANSFARAFETLQKRSAAAVKDARAKALAEGEAKAQQQQLDLRADNQSFFDGVTACVVHGDC
jgi:hypothetical protein